MPTPCDRNAASVMWSYVFLPACAILT